MTESAFPIARYLYEGLPAEQGWVAEVIMEGARGDSAVPALEESSADRTDDYSTPAVAFVTRAF
jgi:hypothetical protein